MSDTGEMNPVVAAVPGGGWAAEYLLPDGTKQQFGLLMWIVRADGSVQPLDVDGEGWPHDPRRDAHFARLVQPEERG